MAGKRNARKKVWSARVQMTRDWWIRKEQTGLSNSALIKRAILDIEKEGSGT